MSTPAARRHVLSAASSGNEVSRGRVTPNARSNSARDNAVTRAPSGTTKNYQRLTPSQLR
jgi:hypothetical protein